MTFSELEYKDKVARLVSWGHWFTFANAILALVISLGYLAIVDLPDTITGQLFLLVYWAGHFSFLTFLIFLALLFPLAFVLIRPWIMQAVSALLASVGVGLLIIDILFFDAYRLHLNLFAFELAISPEGGLLDFQFWQLALVLSFIFIVEFLLGLWLWRSPTRNTTRKLARTTATALTACFFLSHFFHIWADALFYAPITSQKHYFPLSYPATAKTFLRDHGWVDVDKYANEFREQRFSSKTLNYGVQNLPSSQAAYTNSVLVVVIESWRSDMLTEEVMPNLYALSRSGLRFTNHFSGGNGPSEGVFSLLYGLPATYQDHVTKASIPPLVSSALEREGYIRSAFTSSRKLNDRIEMVAFKGFEQFQTGDSGIGNAANDRRIAKQWTQWYQNKESDAPFFTYLSLSAPSNFATPAGYKSPFQPDFEGVHLFSDTDLLDEVQLRNRYKNSLHFVDSLIPAILEPLRKDGSLANTTVIFTSDHGMELNDKGGNNWGYNSNFSSYQTQVPLVLLSSDVGGADIEMLTSHYDISAQLLHQLYGKSVDVSELTSGHPLLGDSRHNWLFMGDAKHFAILEKDRLTELRMSGQYKIYDRGNKRNRSAKLRVKPMREVLEELRRFYSD
ncbi:DUF3413 domain-containing protein [Corallincola platygyrae]|uniref:DUF3413 domain-containing protein n=1 Tax=Corallincola platygyrae TaxID=1193278 RepID=A0ABW4XHS0_9GAMM